MTLQLSFFAEQATPEAQDRLRDELDRLANIAKELTAEIDDLDKRLTPFRREKARLEQAIRETHNQPDGVVVHSWGKAGERKPLYEGLLQLSLEYGGVKKRRLDVIAMRNGYARDYARIEKELDTLKRRKDHKNAKAKARG